MTYEEAIESVAGLEGSPVAVDVIINKPAPPRAGSPPVPTREDNQLVGVLQRRELPVSGDTPADEAVWWHHREGKAVIGVAGEPDSGFLLQRDRFDEARWERETLILDFGAMSWRIVPLVRRDGRSLPVNGDEHAEMASPTA